MPSTARRRHVRRLGLPAGLALVAVTVLAGPASAAKPADSDHDGMPNRWERAHGLNPHSRADATRDLDHDGLTNLREYRLKGDPRAEDTDHDGQDDGDEVRTRTRVDRADTDRDGVLDGDE